MRCIGQTCCVSATCVITSHQPIHYLPIRPNNDRPPLVLKKGEPNARVSVAVAMQSCLQTCSVSCAFHSELQTYFAHGKFHILKIHILSLFPHRFSPGNCENLKTGRNSASCSRTGSRTSSWDNFVTRPGEIPKCPGLAPLSENFIVQKWTQSHY